MKRPTNDAARMAANASAPCLVNLTQDSSVRCTWPNCERSGVSGGWRVVSGMTCLSSYALCRRHLRMKGQK
jgi:hypothetical protein